MLKPCRVQQIILSVIFEQPLLFFQEIFLSGCFMLSAWWYVLRSFKGFKWYQKVGSHGIQQRWLINLINLEGWWNWNWEGSFFPPFFSITKPCSHFGKQSEPQENSVNKQHFILHFIYSIYVTSCSFDMYIAWFLSFCRYFNRFSPSKNTFCFFDSWNFTQTLTKAHRRGNPTFLQMWKFEWTKRNVFKEKRRLPILLEWGIFFCLPLV